MLCAALTRTNLKLCAADPPYTTITTLSYMPLQRTVSFINLNTLNDENQPERTNPLQYYDYQHIGKAENGVISSFTSTTDDSPSSSLTYTVYPSIFKSPVSRTFTPRQSSPLGPRQCSLPGRPVYPPSVCKKNLYRCVLKNQAKKHWKEIRRIRKGF